MLKMQLKFVMPMIIIVWQPGYFYRCRSTSIDKSPYPMDNSSRRNRHV